MSSFVYRLDTATKAISLLDKKRMHELGLTEASDLETWLSGCRHSLFARNVLWLTRQDRPADDQRSDIIGVSSKGDLIVAELKRGTALPDTIMQVFRYAAEYESRTPDDLAALYYEHSNKSGRSALVDKAASESDAQLRIGRHVGDSGVNESQILVILAEGFDDKTLAICDYMMKSNRSATFSIELWSYALHPYENDNSKIVFLLEQVLPHRTIRAQIEAEREAAKAQKRARDPVRSQFVSSLKDYLSRTPFPLARQRGESYAGQIAILGEDIYFTVGRGEEHPTIYIPGSLRIDGDLDRRDLEVGDEEEDEWWISFVELKVSDLLFSNEFGDRFVEVLGHFQSQSGS